MDNDQFTTVTTTSWGERMGASFKGIFVGLLLFIAAIPLLFWNEGRAVDRAKALAQGGSAVVSVASETVALANEGKLVHVSGLAKTDETLHDSDFGIDEQAIHLRRKVEMYQWKEESRSETKEKLGGSSETVTTYTYRKDWSDAPQDSSRFQKIDGHRNPPEMPVKAAETTARDVRLGAFRLNAAQIGSIDRAQPVKLAGRTFPEMLVGKPASVTGDTLYLGRRADNPMVGDVRVRFEVVGQTEISIVAQQQGDSFVPYATDTGEIQLLEYGKLPAQAMFKRAGESNAMMSWLLRAGGFLLMYVGLRMILAPLRTLSAVVPFIASIVGFGLGIVSFLVAASISLIVIAIAWLVARPMLGFALLAIGVALPLALRFLRKPTPSNAAAPLAG